MHDLETVSFGELGSEPLLAGHNIEVQFDRHPVRLHAQLFDQLTERKGTSKAAVFPVDNKFHP